ncbi:hypothetical protein CcCBS67573_g01822 [Chytriomyces confervae]|uniref:Uncharacterized protein n=1 Tax=Chytriomyces confervae TaxID=246404 RepID=A0A507FPD5_9FUNG|nr:hypothetical protein HDU80_009388 [Chytriomyces hyalinus]TPX76897.1 hypothetical protein CcCBS67573_g01822 [Chytriomyces confervae]
MKKYGGPHSFDVGTALYTIFTAVMTQLANNARSSVKQKGGDPTRTGVLLIQVGWVLIGIAVLAGFQSTLMSLGQVAIIAGYLVKSGFNRSWKMIYKPARLRGTTFTLVGFGLILLRYSVLGCLLELLGYACIHGYDHVLVI